METKQERYLKKAYNFDKTYGMDPKETLERVSQLGMEEPIPYVVPDYSAAELQVYASFEGNLPEQGDFGMQANDQFAEAVKTKNYYGLRKCRARLMVDAMTQSPVNKGNLGIRFIGDVFTFFYRGTPILYWTLGGVPKDSYAGEYEASPSTRNQRKMAREAIDEFKERLLSSW